MSRWGEYFEDPLNPTNTRLEEAESDSSETGPPISGAEVAEVVKKLLGGKATHLGVLERRIRQIVESRFQEVQCGFRPGRGTVDQLYTLNRILEGAWEFPQPVYMCFVDFESCGGCSGSMECRTP